MLSSNTGLSPSKVSRSRELFFNNLATYLHHISIIFSNIDSVCPVPCSLAANRGIIVYFLFLPVLRCFNSRRISSSRNKNVVALGNPEIKFCVRIPQAYRSLPRPSSQLKPSYPSNSLRNIRLRLSSLPVSLTIKVSLHSTPKSIFGASLCRCFNSSLNFT